MEFSSKCTILPDEAIDDLIALLEAGSFSVLIFEREWKVLLTNDAHYHPVKIVWQRMTIITENTLLDKVDFKRHMNVPL